MKKQNGITLIALVITIIVLLILAGVSISLVIGDNGILTQATEAVTENRKAKAIEDISIAWTTLETEYIKEWTKNTSASKDNFFSEEEKFNKYLDGEVSDVIYENGITRLSYKPNEDSEIYNLIINSKGKVAESIAFKIDDVYDSGRIYSCYAEKGMTWKEWANSEYKIYQEDTANRANDESFFMFDKNDSSVEITSDTIIKADGEYVLPEM